MTNKPKNTIPHPLRKNGAMAELYKKRRREQNRARGPQTYNPSTKEWTR